METLRLFQERYRMPVKANLRRQARGQKICRVTYLQGVKPTKAVKINQAVFVAPGVAYLRSAGAADSARATQDFTTTPLWL